MTSSPLRVQQSRLTQQHTNRDRQHPVCYRSYFAGLLHDDTTRLPILSRDLYDSAMSELQERMPYVAAFPEALGTGIIVRSAQPISPVLQRDLQSFIDEYDATPDSVRIH